MDGDQAADTERDNEQREVERRKLGCIGKADKWDMGFGAGKGRGEESAGTREEGRGEGSWGFTKGNEGRQGTAEGCAVHRCHVHGHDYAHGVDMGLGAGG